MMSVVRVVLFLVSALAVCTAVADPRREPRSIYEHINFLKRIASVNAQHPTGQGELPFFGACDANCQQQSADELELEQRAKDEPDAAFYRGLLAMETAYLFRRGQGGDRLVEAQARKAKQMFELSSKAGNAAASWNIALMYADNLGVTGSNLAAIEWYARAGLQFLAAGDRETALAALERIEKMDSKHPDSQRLRAALFNPKSK